MTNNSVAELMRCIKSQVEGLIPGLQAKELAAMSLGLGHKYDIKNLFVLSNFLPHTHSPFDTVMITSITLLSSLQPSPNLLRSRHK